MNHATQTRAARLPSLLLALPLLLLAGCAQIPASSVAESQFTSLTCEGLAQQTREAKATMTAAEQARSDSWYAVLPFIVAARYGQASSAASEAERRLALLSEQSDRQGCAR
jgi:hypothetical protein